MASKSRSKAKAKPASKKPATLKPATVKAVKPKIAAKPAAKRAPAKPPAAKPKARARSEFGTIKGKPEIASPLPFHPLANIFPLIEGREFEELVDSIRANGLRDPIIVHDGQVLDGRNRQNASIAAGVACRYEILPASQDALKFVIDKNLRRRQLNESQRAVVAAKLANLSHGGARRFDDQAANLPFEDPLPSNVTQAEAADLLNVSERSVRAAKTVNQKGVAELQTAVEQGEIAVSAAEKIARLPQEQQPAAVAAAKPHGARSIMSSRQEPDDSLDFFPTPPWATRALMERVMPQLGEGVAAGVQNWTAWEPACGEGHMAQVLAEYFLNVTATDIRDYGYAFEPLDFLSDQASQEHDWVITNPPFGDKTEAFVLRSLELARTGVAMFVRLQWLETIGRYERLFRDKPPTLIAFFCERVNLCKGRWEPEGATATAYIWLVWLKGEQPRAPFWIPPGCREGLTHADDAVRFTAHPVMSQSSSLVDPVPSHLDLAEPDPEITELQALETIEAGREIDIKLPIVSTLKGKKYARGSVKLKLTKLGMVQLEALRQEAYEAHDAPAPVVDLGAADGDQAQEGISQVDCRVCSEGTGVCAQCIAAADHVVSYGIDGGSEPATAFAHCSCGFEYAGELGADLGADVIKAHWQNVVTEVNAAAESIAPQGADPLDIPESLRRAPAEAAE